VPCCQSINSLEHRERDQERDDATRRQHPPMARVGNVHPSACFLGYNRSNQPNPAHKRCQMLRFQSVQGKVSTFDHDYRSGSFAKLCANQPVQLTRGRWVRFRVAASRRLVCRQYSATSYHSGTFHDGYLVAIWTAVIVRKRFGRQNPQDPKLGRNGFPILAILLQLELPSL